MPFREPKEPIKWKNQEKIKLTKEEVEEAEPSSIIKTGFAYKEHPWFNDAKKVEDGGNLEDDNRSVKIKYVIYRGGTADWCIYHSLNANLTRSSYLQNPEHLKASFDRIAKHGGKIIRKEEIKAIVDCDEETFNLYRY